MATDTPKTTTRELLDIKQVAERIGMSATTIHHKRRTHKDEVPPAIRIGRKLFWRPKDVDQWIDNRPTV